MRWGGGGGGGEGEGNRERGEGKRERERELNLSFKLLQHRGLTERECPVSDVVPFSQPTKDSDPSRRRELGKQR